MAKMPRKRAVPSLRFDVLGLRKELGLDQDELARLIQSTERSVRRWEREGINPHRTTVLLMKRLLEERKSLKALPQVMRAERRGKHKTAQHVPSRPLGILPSSL